jgi:phage-related minor tail protein
MTSIRQWLTDHFSAILVTAVTVSKAGLLGKVGTAIVAAIAAACGVN